MADSNADILYGVTESRGRVPIFEPIGKYELMILDTIKTIVRDLGVVLITPEIVSKSLKQQLFATHKFNLADVSAAMLVLCQHNYLTRDYSSESVIAYRFES